MASPASTVSVGEVELIFKPHPEDVERLKLEAEMNAKNSGVSTPEEGSETADRFIRTTGNTLFHWEETYNR